MAKLVKFEKNSVEAETIRSVKQRQKKIDKAGVTLVGLWYEQGKELLELQSVLECSQRQLVEYTGLKRSALQAYMNIAQDPRLGEEDVIPKLANFTQKELVKLGQLDEDEFNEAVDTGVLPATHVDATDTKPSKKTDRMPVEDTDIEPKQWQAELITFIMDAKDYESAKATLLAHFAEDAVVVEEEPEPETVDEDVDLLKAAIEATGEDTVEDQAEALGLKKGVLKTAIEDGVMSKATIKKLKAYIA